MNHRTATVTDIHTRSFRSYAESRQTFRPQPSQVTSAQTLIALVNGNAVSRTARKVGYGPTEIECAFGVQDFVNGRIRRTYGELVSAPEVTLSDKSGSDFSIAVLTASLLDALGISISMNFGTRHDGTRTAWVALLSKRIDADERITALVGHPVKSYRHADFNGILTYNLVGAFPGDAAGSKDWAILADNNAHFRGTFASYLVPTRR